VTEDIIVMRRGENPLQVCARIEKMADEINERYLPPGVKLVPYYDRTGLTERTLHTVGHNMIEGIALVAAGAVPLFWGWATGVPRLSWRWPYRLRCWGRF